MFIWLILSTGARETSGRGFSSWGSHAMSRIHRRKENWKNQKGRRGARAQDRFLFAWFLANGLQKNTTSKSCMVEYAFLTWKTLYMNDLAFHFCTFTRWDGWMRTKTKIKASIVIIDHHGLQVHFSYSPQVDH